MQYSGSCGLFLKLRSILRYGLSVSDLEEVSWNTSVVTSLLLCSMENYSPYTAVPVKTAMPNSALKDQVERRAPGFCRLRGEFVDGGCGLNFY